MSDCRNLLREVQMNDFALLEADLFLDTHPKNKEAMEYFEYFRKLAKESRKEYERAFGPLQFQDAHCADYWQWAKGPWPWECGV